ncbi:energy transducer TonB [Pleomorphomonas carboxyditropha]|uniref:Energy transducer TonB n=1 Tax=Pleomorphomonas carboxyditropha TaxID=2023338 RepID=A0A2G9WZL4_9HYPH|nr:energy transducer TonB [Pleomorphomonas carboxyditropha]PIP00169.1 energy transducer TonB [Pleomorphomonas carboxyditropha]
MSGWSASVGRGAKAAEAALWTAAGLIVLSAHLGAAAWLTRQPPTAAVDAPPAAIMIEFADVPEAILTEADDLAPDQQDAPDSPEAERVEAPETPPERIVEKEPAPVEEEVATDEIEPAEEATILPIIDAEVPIPLAKPKPPEPKKKAERRQQEQAASQAAMAAQAQVRQSDRNAARQSASGLLSSASSLAKWQARLMAHLERRKRYPAGARSRREQGVAYVRFAIDDAGNVLSAVLARSSGFPELDNEVLALVRRASPLPAPPPGVPSAITTPVLFDLK